MDSGSSDRSARPSDALMSLMLATGSEHSLFELRRDVDSIGKTSASSALLLRTFLKTQPRLAEEFLDRSGIDERALVEALSADHPPEPPPDPPQLPENPTDEQVKLHQMFVEMDEKRRKEGRAETMTGPIRRALKSAKAAARAAGKEHLYVGEFLGVLLETEAIAAGVVQRLANRDRLGEALAWLRAQIDEPNRKAVIDLAKIKADARRHMDAAWPQLRAKSGLDEEMRRQQDELYEKDPARYEEPLDIKAELAKIPPSTEWTYRLQGGVYHRAAENEARRLRASEATLDHLLLALLRNETDTSAFLSKHGVDTDSWRRQLEERLPKFEEGPRWPPDDRALGMARPDNAVTRLKPLPEGVRLEDLPREEARKYVERTYDEELRFTDLKYLAPILDEPETIGHDLFRATGITQEDFKAEILAQERNDDDWWRKSPNLLDELEKARRSGLCPEMQMCQVCEDAARYEARMRGADEIEHDDLLMALLVPGTDLWNLLVDLGPEPSAIKAEIDGLRPRLERRTMFPEVKDSWLGIMGMAKEGFSDLLFVSDHDLPPPEPLRGWALLRQRGLSPEAVQKRLEDLGVKTI